MAVSGLRRSLTIVLTIKIAVILMAAIFVFAPSQRPRIDARALDRQFLDPENSANQGRLQ